MASAASPQTLPLLSFADLNFFLINKLVVLLVVLCFFTAVIIYRRFKSMPVQPVAMSALKLAVLGLVMLYFEATLAIPSGYRLLLERLQSVVVLIAVAKLTLYLIVDMVMPLRRHGDVPMLLRDAVRLAVYLAAAIASLRLVFQIDLSAVLTTTTVLTAAVAFAMQNTLANAFYGFNVQIDKEMARGNWITLPEKNLFGQIVNVGFRYTTLVTLDNNKVLVPNAMIVQSIVTTHGNVGEAARDRAAATLTIGLPYELPPEEARAILLSVLMEEPLVLKDPQPLVRLQNMADSSVVYLMKFWLGDPQQRNQALDAVQTKAWYAVNRAGWGFPFPHRQLVSAPPRPSFPPSRDAVVDGLKHSHLFDVLSAEEVGILADRAHLRVFAPGEAAVRQGEPGESLFFVLGGSMAVEVDGHQVATLEKGRMFGEMSLLTGEPRSATVKALGEARLAEVMKSDLACLLERNERLLEKLGEALERHEAGIRDHMAARAESLASNQPGAGEYLRRIKAFFFGGGHA